MLEVAADGRWSGWSLERLSDFGVLAFGFAGSPCFLIVFYFAVVFGGPELNFDKMQCIST